MTRFGMTLSIAVVVGLTLVSGGIHGWMSSRWGPSRQTRARAENLNRLPSKIGSWQLQSSEKMSDYVLNTLECLEYIVRTYVNQETGETVRLAIIAGPPGPTAVHTPEICYSSRNYTIREEPRRITVPEESEHQFWRLTLKSNDLSGNLLRVYYAWSIDGRWSAPDEPRVTFAGHPLLYKIQVAGDLPPGTDLQTSDVCVRFLRELVSAARDCLTVRSDG